MTERTLDRLPSFDPASRAFPIRTLVEMRAPRSYTWRLEPPSNIFPVTTLPLDQGAEGACVGFGWTHELVARPRPHPQLDDSFARIVYRAAQRIDEWPGEAYEGTSVLAGAKVCQQEGFFREYRWAFGLNDLILAIGYAGPAVLGLNWYTGMMRTAPDGYIRPTGVVEGGHCVMANRVSVKGRFVEGPNSWGPGWGVGGRWRLSFDDMAYLLSDQGEACIPVQRATVG